MSTRSSFTEYDWEPVPGLPGRLPPGETLLWQGRPDWRALARRAFQVRKLAVYMVVLLLWRVVSGVLDGEPAGAIAWSMLWIVPLAAAGVAIPAILGWAYARSTVYSITTRRIVVRSGVALPMAVNVPFAVVESASARIHADGTGDLPLTLLPGNRVSWLQLWPHLRPWRLARPEPMLRCVPDGAHVSALLGDALREAAEERAPSGVRIVRVQPKATALREPADAASSIAA